ncbi:MAG: NAD(P)H-dependent oxidoreductase subunit E [Candidatus Eiseniibacteriota bacterium]|nr:MAG: NAD(P)H-dependent oxidoreductase subunit E [Candidatus Eisenbacteria bacterium]
MSDQRTSAIVEKYGTDESATLSALQDLQEEHGYLPREALLDVSKRMEVPLSRVLSLATFFNAFSLKPKGKHHVNVCMGTACHVRGSQLILEKLERELGIKSGDTTPDRNFSLDAVRCVGCCGLAPVIMVGDTFHGKLSQAKVPGVLKKYGK